jgi:peroxiredoxin Q/BCP
LDAPLTKLEASHQNMVLAQAQSLLTKPRRVWAQLTSVEVLGSADMGSAQVWGLEESIASRGQLSRSLTHTCLVRAEESMPINRQIGVVVALWWGAVIVVLVAGPALASQVGDQAPDLSLPATTKDPVRLADYRGQMFVVVYFFTSAFGGA